MTTTVIRLDVWGGKASMDHLARTHFTTIVLGLALAVPTMLHLLRSLMIDEGWLVRHAATYGLSDLLEAL